MNINLSQFYNGFRLKIEETKTGCRALWRDTALKIFLLTALLLDGVSWTVSVIINNKTAGDVIALHHNVYFGITLIGAAKEIYFIPFLGLPIITVNGLFLYLIKEGDKFFLYLFSASAVLVNVFLMLGLAAIVLINFR